MGTGSSALLWYFLCFGFVAFVVALAAGLIVYGRAKEERARAARREKRMQSPTNGGIPRSSPDEGHDRTPA